MATLGTNARKNYLWGLLGTSIGNVIIMAVSLAMTMVAARMLDKAELGAYFLAMIVIQFAVGLGDIGFISTVVTFSSSAKDKDVLRTCQFLTTVNAIVALVASIVLACLLPSVARFSASPLFESLAWITIPITFFTLTFQLGLYVLAANRNFKSMVYVNTWVEILRTGGAIGGLFLGYGVLAMLWMLLLSRLIGLFILWSKTPLMFRPRIRHGNSLEMLRFSGWMYGSSLLSIINGRLADIVLTKLMGTTALANYGAALQIPTLLQKAFEAVRPVLLSYVASRNGQLGTDVESADSLPIEIRRLTGILALLSCGLALLAKPIAIFLFSVQYSNIAPTVQVLCCWSCIALTNYYLGIVITGEGRSKRVFLLLLPQLVTIAIALPLLVPSYQELGAAMSLVLMSSVGNLMCCWEASNRSTRRFQQLLETCAVAFLPIVAATAILVWAGNHSNVLWTTALLIIAWLLISGAIRVGELKTFTGLVWHIIKR